MVKHNVNKKFMIDIGLDVTTNVTLCHTCLRIVKIKKVPSINVTNGLDLDDVPEELKLNDLEQQLIARCLLFLKIKKLPKTLMKASIDNVINVPLECQDITENISKLPRHPDDAQIVAVQLKRRLEYKSSHLQEFIRPDIVKKALLTLKQIGNPFYQDIDIDDNFMEREEGDIEMETESQAEEKRKDEKWEREMKKAIEDAKVERANRIARRNALKDCNNTLVENMDSLETNDCIENDSEDESDTTLKAVKNHQSKQNINTFLVPNDLSNRVVRNDGTLPLSKEIEDNNGNITIAPGEGKIPTNLMREDHFDVKAFPKHFPSGKFGLHFFRKHQLSAQMYFNQRLLNCDDRLSRDPCYIFTAAYYTERQRIEKQIDISGKIIIVESCDF